MKIIKTLTYPSRLSEFLISKLITNELNKRSRAHLLANPLPVAIFAQDFIGNEIQTMGFYEKKHLECLFEFLHPLSDEFKNGYALDIGANIGNHTLFFQNRFKHVISFEPSPLIFKLLKFNVTPFSNVTVHNFALGENYSQSLLHLKNSNLGSSTLIHDRQ